jgi:hypothetical protein
LEKPSLPNQQIDERFSRAQSQVPTCEIALKDFYEPSQVHARGLLSNVSLEVHHTILGRPLLYHKVER